MGFVKCGCVYVWVLQSVGVCMCGFCKRVGVSMIYFDYLLRVVSFVL